MAGYIIIDVYRLAKKKAAEQAEQAAQAPSPEDLTEWERELAKDKAPSYTACTVDETCTRPPENVRSRQRESITRALHMADKALAELPDTSVGVAGYLKGSKVGGDKGYEDSPLARYLRAAITKNMPFDLAVPDIRVYSFDVALDLGPFSASLTLPTAVAGYSAHWLLSSAKED